MISDFFRLTIERYKISEIQLSQLSGVSENHILEFRCGKTGISEEVLWKLIEAMEDLRPGSRVYFCDLLAGGDGFSRTNKVSILQLQSLWEMQSLVDSLSDDRLAVLLTVVAARIRNSALTKNNNSDIP